MNAPAYHALAVYSFGIGFLLPDITAAALWVLSDTSMSITWLFEPVAATGSTLALRLSHDQRDVLDKMPAEYNIIIRRSGPKEAVAVGDAGGQVIAQVEFNAFPEPDYIRFGEDTPWMMLSSWWKREENRRVYKKYRSPLLQLLGLGSSR
jgi:hypothetical protein